MNKKKIVGMVLALGVIGSVFAPMSKGVFAKADAIDLADQSFLEFIASDTDREEGIEYTHAPLYDEELQVNGRRYDFSIGETDGYALLTEIWVGNQVFYEVEELFYSKQSPFDECVGLPVYVTHNLYLEYKNDGFYNLQTGDAVSQATVEEYAAKGFGYSGDGSVTEVTQTVNNYATKETETYTIQYDLPNYMGSVYGVTSCANTAGAIILGYYDRFYENLIPNYQSYTRIGSVVRYKTGTTEVFNLVNELYDLMGTDSYQLGTTFAGFQSGMQQYVTGKGYTYTTVNMFINGSLNMNSYKNAVQAGKPVALFLSGFAMFKSLDEAIPTDTITSDFYNSTHATVGCGYKIDKYYNANGQLINTRNYLRIASGLEEYDIGYLNINGLGQLDRAISVEIS